MSVNKSLTILGKHFLSKSEFELGLQGSWQFLAGKRTRIDPVFAEENLNSGNNWLFSLKNELTPNKKISKFLQNQLDLNCGILELNFFEARLFLSETEHNSQKNPEDLANADQILKLLKANGIDREVFLNNILYHPLLAAGNSSYENDIINLNLLELLITPEISAKIAGLDYLIITGEAFWSGWLSLFMLHKFLNKYAGKDLEVVFDKTGIWQAILYQSQAYPELLKLDKGFFLPDLTFKAWSELKPVNNLVKIELSGADELKKDLYWESSKRAGFFDLKSSNFLLENRPLGRFLSLKESRQQSQKVLSKREYREWWKNQQVDYLLEFKPAILSKSLQSNGNLTLYTKDKLDLEVKSNQEIKPGEVIAKELGVDSLKIWIADDYQLEVRDSELVSKDQLVAKKTRVKGIFKKVIRATANGKISLKNLADGYVLLEMSKHVKPISIDFEARFIQQAVPGNGLVFQSPLQEILLKSQIGSGFSGTLRLKYNSQTQEDQLLYLPELSWKNLLPLEEMPYLTGIIIGGGSYGDLLKLIEQYKFIKIGLLNEFSVSGDEQLGRMIKQGEGSFVCVEENRLKIPLKMLFSQKTIPDMVKGTKVQTLTFSKTQIYGNLEKVFASGKLLISNQKELWEGDLVNTFLLSYA